jgi:hypothetical protein
VRLTTRYAPETGPLLQVGLQVVRGEQLGPVVTIIAMVDSGAFTTCLPLEVAADLGLGDDELGEDAEGGFGVGSAFRFWRSTMPINGGVGRSTLQGTIEPWGPGFGMAPVFTEHDSFLLGRQDFFTAFGVTFDEGNGDGPTFHLDAPDEVDDEDEPE